jgi:type I restriction enzyme S subunit
VSELPAGWQLARLDELCEWGSGGTPRRSEPSYFGGEYPWITISDLNDGVVSRTAEFLTEAGIESSAAKLVPERTVLVALYGSIGKLGITAQPSTTNQAIACALPDDAAFDPLYLFHFLRSRRNDLALQGTGVTQKNIYLGDIKAFLAPVAPRAEQTRIVAKLEALLSDLDAGVAELNTAQRKLQQYRQSLLKSAVEGALTAPWREAQRQHGIPTETGAQLLQRILNERRAIWEAKQLTRFKEQGKAAAKDWQKKYPEPVQPDSTDLPKLPEGWVWASLDMLGEIASGVAKGTKRHDNVSVREVPYLRVANVQRGYLDLSEVKTILATERDIEELTLKSGDVLFNEGGDRDKLGRGWVWHDEVEGCIHQNHVFRMRPYSPDLRPELISHHGNTFGKQWFQAAGKQTTNLASINMSMLRSFPVPVAPAEEQVEVLAQIRVQVDSLDRQREATDLAMKQATAQRQNILRTAFAGQLVPQDPNDERADMLLERIRAERAERAKQPKVRRIKQEREIAAVVKKLMDVLAEAGDWVPAQEAFRRCGVADGALTERIEELYAELRTLDKTGRLAVEAVTDVRGRKLHDKLKLLTG